MDTTILFQASLGHRKSACHPRMRPFLLPRSRLAIDLIDPHQVQASLARATNRIRQLQASQALVLWVGSARHARLLQAVHGTTGDPVLYHRWPGGLLTNFQQVSCSPKGQLRGLHRLPDAVVLLCAHENALALQEARACGVQVIAVVDTNMDPDGVDLPILGNDDALSVSAAFLETLIG